MSATTETDLFTLRRVIDTFDPWPRDEHRWIPPVVVPTDDAVTSPLRRRRSSLAAWALALSAFAVLGIREFTGHSGSLAGHPFAAQGEACRGLARTAVIPAPPAAPPSMPPVAAAPEREDDGPAFTRYGNFAITHERFRSRGNRNEIIERIVGPGYRHADWRDVLTVPGDGGGLLDVVEFMERLHIGPGKQTPLVTLRGKETRWDRKRKTTRDFFVMGLSGKKTRHGDVEADYRKLIAVGSWQGRRPLLAVRKTPPLDYFEGFRRRRLPRGWEADNGSQHPCKIFVESRHLTLDLHPNAGGYVSGGVFTDVDLPVSNDTVIGFDMFTLTSSIDPTQRTSDEQRVGSTITLDLVLQDGRTVQTSYAYGFYLERGFTERPGWKQVQRHQPRMVWQRGLRHRIRDTWPDAVALRRIAFHGYGKRYEVSLDNLMVFELPAGWAL